MGKLAEAYVDIGANLKPMQAGLGRARSMLTSFAGSATGMLASVGVGVGVVSIAKGLIDAAKKASGLGESLSKVQTTFGPASKAVIAQADEMAKRFGVIKRESLDAAAAFGLMAQAGGMSASASAKVGNELVKLGVDLASFHNITNAEAFEKLRSGLAGEAEPLRPLGILLSEDAVKAEALAIGLTKVKRELNEQEKVVARLSLIRRQAGPAVGDKERTKDSAENQMKQFAGDVENAATEFGNKLLPALTSALALARELGTSLSNAFGPGTVDAFTTSLKTAVDTMRIINAVQTSVGMVVDPQTGKAVKRTQENSMGGFLGLSMTPAAPTNLQVIANKIVGGQAAPGNGFGTRAAQQARFDAEQKMRDARDEAIADDKARARWLGPLAAGPDAAGPGSIFADRQTADQRMGDRFALQDALHDAFQGAPLAQALVGGDLLGHIGREEAARRDAEVNRENRENDEAEIRKKHRFDSQQFSSGGDFASMAIQKALSSPEDDAMKKELEELRKSGISLQELTKLGNEFISMVKTAPPLRAIMRGSA